MVTNGKKYILMIDDDEDDFFLVNALLQDISPDQYILKWVSSYKEALAAIETRTHDLYLVDYRLGAHTGIDVLHHFRNLGYKAPVILFTGKGDYLIDKEAMLAGASDYLVKSEINAALLERAIRYTLDKFGHLNAIEKSEKRYFSIFEKSNDLILLADCEHKIVAANPAALQVLGYEETELYSRHLPNLFAEEGTIQAFLDQLCTENGVVQQEYVFRNQAGQLLDVMINASLLDEKKQLYLCIIQNITERKRKEREKQQQEKFAITGRIARLIAHEVRNPLTNILLAVSQLKADQVEENADIQLYLDIMERNCHRINQLVTELLQSTRMSELNMQPQGLNSLAEKALQQAADRLQLHNMRVDKTLQTPDQLMMADEDKILIALLNIIINGIEAMKAGEGILSVYTYHEQDKTYIRISDNGSGIPKENLVKLFEPFFTSKTKGTGLGLTATQNIILHHKGTIQVESMPGTGTSFLIGFPVVQTG
ncbi:hybrid sensor histidine kinase/response regulator [Chitinophaga nivalis]|uniref:histidine kinase n=1 Tax=Chitinophaga nivalis TaxID=2991709 RepID=A0ABT3IT75_9BACT|nr:hybrid sensor histidine kinase/response regulator [Chitinophaga nivalis]MCW3463124.1 PAS domain S-box protein [Chitinophaga nivalis]MCW3487186.1 PAS domain S-box protein [Chitinophaga nivalis]